MPTLRVGAISGWRDPMRALFRHDWARPRRAVTEQLEMQMRLLPVGPFPRCVRHLQAADATRKRERGYLESLLACQSWLHRDEPGGGQAVQSSSRSLPPSFLRLAACRVGTAHH